MKRILRRVVTTCLLSATYAIAAGQPQPMDSKVASDCTFGGKALHGKVQIVEHFADFKVQVVEHFPDLKVKLVEHFPDQCGEWQVVEHFPDFTVQYVEHFPDFTIEKVEHFPGVP